MKINISDINSNLTSGIGLLVCSSSFEERWYKVAESLSDDNLNKIIILQKSLELEVWNKGIASLRELHGNIDNIVHIEDLAPAELWKKIVIEVVPSIESESGVVLIDITTFTHEVVLLLLALLKDKGLLNKVVFAYSGAGEYCTSEGLSEKWLSRGVKDIRSVLGYPGVIRPSKKSHLIILVGFETERAKELVAQYEPTSISLGIGNDPYNNEFQETNIWHKEQLERFVASIENSRMRISEFNFSCSDPMGAKNAILEEAGKFNDLNITIAPMNTKVSTVAAGLAAFDDERLKLCYVEPAEYNKRYYSLPGECATLIQLQNKKK